MLKLLALVALVAGCEANLGTGEDDNTNTTPDASRGGGGSNVDSAVQQQQDATAPACANGRKVFLNFEGVAVTQGTPSDSALNRISWMSNASATLPAYHAGAGDRAAQITAITAGVKARLAATPIEVVTQRPATGPYVMVIFGGTAGQLGTIYSYATNQHDCGDAVKSDVAWVSDTPPVDYVPDLAVGAIGWGLGLNGTTEPSDCMCAWASTCTDDAAAACTLSASIATGTLLSPETACPNQNPQNEVAAFSTGFCQ